jgi:hypothetical protein
MSVDMVAFEKAIKESEEKGAEVETHYPSLFTCLVFGHSPPCIRCVKCRGFIRPEKMEDLCPSSES